MPPGALGRLEDLDAVALARELPGGGEAGRARADDGDLLAVLLGLLDGLRLRAAAPGLAVPLVGDEALEAADRQRALELAARALALAGRVAGAPERADERRRLEHQVERLVVLAAAHARDVAVRLDARRALVGARRDALAADDGLLRHRLREGDEGRAPRHHVGVVLVRHGDVAGHLALATAGAGGLVDELGLLADLGVVAGRCRSVAAVAADASTSAYVSTSMLGWWMVAPILGVEMQLAQSSVGKTLLSRIILPPTLGSFSTTRTL